MWKGRIQSKVRGDVVFKIVTLPIFLLMFLLSPALLMLVLGQAERDMVRFNTEPHTWHEIGISYDKVTGFHIVHRTCKKTFEEWTSAKGC